MTITYEDGERLAEVIASRYAAAHGLSRDDAEDMVQECRIVLWEKVMPRVDPTRDRGQQTSYVMQSIMGTCRKWVGDKGFTIRLPRALTEDPEKLAAAPHAVRGHFGPEDNDEHGIPDADFSDVILLQAALDEALPKLGPQRRRAILDEIAGGKAGQSHRERARHSRLLQEARRDLRAIMRRKDQ